MSDLTKSWAICETNGDIKVDTYGRVLIFESRRVAREFLHRYEFFTPSRIEKVEIR